MIGAVVAATVHGGEAAKPTAPAISLMADGYYAREPADREWSIRLRGTIPSLCGAWLLVFDPAGKVLHSGQVAHGVYPDDRPFTVTLPADGRTGDCMIKLIGMQEDLMSLRLPLTDLPMEVYGGRNFAVRTEKGARLCFKGFDRPRTKPSLEESLAAVTEGGPAPAEAGQTRVTLGAYKGHLVVKNGTGKVVANTRTPLEGTEIESGKYDNLTTFPTVPGETYWLEQECMYFGSTNTLYVACEPGHWFQPDLRFEAIKWWTLK